MTRGALGASVALAVAVAVVVATAVWWVSPSAGDPGLAPPGSALPSSSTAAADPALSIAPVAVATGASAAWFAGSPVDVARAPAAALGSDQVPDLRAGPEGRLMVDAHTRDELERLLALNDRAEAQALLQRLEHVLPPAAYRQAVDAFYAYQNYSIAAAQLTSPVQPIADEGAALRQLDALHALRVEHFGTEVAGAYFGAEEATSRALITAMQARPDDGATLAERAERAQMQPTGPR